MGCQFSCSTLCLDPQNELLSLAYNARKKLYIFLGISQGENSFLASSGTDTIPQAFIPNAAVLGHG